MPLYKWLCALGLSMMSMAKLTFATERGGHALGKTIAYAVSVTHDGPYMDGAAVLAHAIRKATASSQYGYDLIAFVHPSVRTSREPLRRAGWKLLERETPVDVSAIRGDYLRKEIVKNGCCGAAELLKLYAWTLTDYHRVVHLDMDSLVLENMDELFEHDVSLVYTCDVAMRMPDVDVCPVQGGFLVVRPEQRVFDEMVDVVLEGDFREWEGWGGTGIGWWWGGATIQGLLPYYFEYLKRGEQSMEVDDCVYNNMAGRDWCKMVAKPYIKNVHFTFCRKPWECIWHEEGSYCEYFNSKWFKMREEVEANATGLASTEPCQYEIYRPIKFLQGKETALLLSAAWHGDAMIGAEVVVCAPNAWMLMS